MVGVEVVESFLDREYAFMWLVGAEIVFNETV